MAVRRSFEAKCRAAWESKDMKITDVKLTVFQRPGSPSDGDVMIKGQSMRALITEVVAVQVMTDEGLTGEALSLGGGRGLAYYLATTVKPLLIGRDPEYLEALWQEMWEMNRLWFSPLFTLGTIDTALWDLYGKILNRPIYKILGAYRDKIPVYASSMTKATAEEFVEEALAYKERGFQGYKLHVLGEYKFDIECCAAVRDAVGADYPLMVDAVSAYNQREALIVGRKLEELDYYWFEEPLRDYDIHGYKMLADKLDIPVMGVEVIEGSIYTTPEFIINRAIDIVRSDVSMKCGVNQVKKTAGLAEAFGMNIEIHTNPNPLLDAVNLQVALSVKNTDFFEQLVPESLVNFGVKESVMIDSEGFAHAPKGPGHGIEIDWDFVNRYKILEL
jgi:L-alanine-DL-glutamate epimerase-like enolase superfamily enzyme